MREKKGAKRNLCMGEIAGVVTITGQTLGRERILKRKAKDVSASSLDDGREIAAQNRPIVLV